MKENLEIEKAPEVLTEQDLKKVGGGRESCDRLYEPCNSNCSSD